MKIRILSDLHLEFQEWAPPDAQADVIVLAGDIHTGARGVEWARRQFPVTPVVYVPGMQRAPGRIEPPTSGERNRIQCAEAM